MKLPEKPSVFTAIKKKRILTYQSDLSDEEITINGEKYLIKKKNILPTYNPFSSVIFNTNRDSFSLSGWTTLSFTHFNNPPSDEERRSNAKDNLRNSIIRALKLKVPEEDIENMLDVAITYLVMDE